MNLEQFLRERYERGTFGIDDVLGCFLPLVREVIAAHRAGCVAPLEGLADLRVESGRIWFEEAKRRPLRRNVEAIGRLEESTRAAIEVLTSNQYTIDLRTGENDYRSAEVGERGAALKHPLFLPGYVAWEHELDHHDPLTDIFSLGLILASLACGVDLNEPDELDHFVLHRRNLFALKSDLHPALAQAILRMTELDRHRRVQDLPALLASLENYRDQPLDLSFDLALLPGLQARDNDSRTSAILTRLRDRLFDVSRRNSLLHFRATLGTLNLTQASIPLLLDIRNIREDQVLTWNDALREALLSDKPVSLNKYLNFTEALYLPSLLERIMADARRDQQEYGFAQLRLVVCFLSWANLKVKPAETCSSPLVLLPVRLSKAKGIRDTFQLEALAGEAEVNPVVRHQFRQLYDIELPETVDLTSGGLDALFDYLSARIRASEPAVTIERIDRPRIDLLHEKAKRRVDQYQRSARVSGRGVRSYSQVDYSYDPANYHPLGVKLFALKVRTPSNHLREMLEERPRPRSYVAPDENTAPTEETERTFFQVRDASEANPYLWNFDLCSVTLANFHYRRISLVRDYEALAAKQRANGPFEATFAMTPRPVGRALPEAPPLADRFDVVPCDPTQATAIAEARRGESYIIQGPPGTGKSQTITNLIADFAARGQRVLFVCEKRAAIDVVFARLRQTGLGALCCVIHDSQADKKQFVLDLKDTYETLLDESKPTRKKKASRDTSLRSLCDELAPLEHFERVMENEHELVGKPPRALLDRCLRLQTDRPEFGPEEAERLPAYVEWERSREALAGIEPVLRDLEPSGVLSRHPLRYLSPTLIDVERPMETVGRIVTSALRELDQVVALLRKSGVPAEAWETMDRAEQLVEYAARVAPLAAQENLPLLEVASARSRAFERAQRQLANAEAALVEAQRETIHWRHKLAAADVQAALEQAQAFQTKSLAWLSWSWWRLRSLLQRSYNFGAHQVQPSWTTILTKLKVELDAAAARDTVLANLRQEYHLEGELSGTVEELRRTRSWAAGLPTWLQRIHHAIVKSEQGARFVQALLAASHAVEQTRRELDGCLADYGGLPWESLRKVLVETSHSLRDVPRALDLLGRLRRTSPAVAAALRESPWPISEFEAAVAHQTWQRLCQADRVTERFRGESQRASAAKLERLYDQWLDANSNEILGRVRQRFLEHVRISNLTASQLVADQKEFKKAYAQGRRTLEHEFAKSMRYRSIRELVEGDSGLVIRDLKPVWLMSPLSVSDTLPLTDEFFDVVIFDEASQVPLEESVPSLFRGRQVIVVGDEMQLPPTDFFSVKRDAADEAEDGGEQANPQARYDLSSASLLNHASKNLPSTMLGWHYRSRSESLISFSNWAFYDGRLLTVPDEQCLDGTAAEVADSPGCELLLRRAVSFHFLPDAVYDKRRNRGEAEFIAKLVCDLLKRREGQSLGIIAFSEAQQDEIEGALQRLAQADDEFRQLYEEELQREVDGQFVGLLVKNLENIQGDERDVVLLSVCYGPGPNGKMFMNFGPINQSGGEKRLNVAFSRAKHRMAIVSSIRSTAITNDYNEGANCLKNYLRYAEAVSAGDADSAQRVLAGISRWRDRGAANELDEDAVCEALGEWLAEQGWRVDRGVGQSHFRVDLAVRRPGESRYRLGILVDTLANYEQSESLEREVMRPRLLRDFGWQVTTVLAKDWYENPAAEQQRLRELLDQPEN